MPLKLDLELSPEQIEEMQATPPASWFSTFEFANATSPRHPSAFLDEATDYKRSLVVDWMKRIVPSATVLDVFSANGSFSFFSQALGAASVTGVEYDAERVARSEMVAQFVGGSNQPQFICGDAYNLHRLVPEPADVVLAMGGLYHVADPPYVLDQLRAVTKNWLIVQTSNVVPLPGNWGRFALRERQEGLTSYADQRGAWHLTRGCFRSMLHHARFRVIEERWPPLRRLKTAPWYLALAKPV